MADTQIEILIKAVDEFSTTLKKIDKNTTTMAKDVTKQTETMGESFSRAQGNVLVLGQAALSVGNIFDTYENTQIRVENASIRVEEAQKNVRDAQYELQKVMSDSTATAADIAKAQDDLATSSNRLTVAENGLQKANGDVWKSWVEMGLQGITLLASLPTLISTVISLGTALWTGVPALYAQAAGFLAITVAGAPLWAIILAIIAAVALIIIIFKNWDDITRVLGEAWLWLKDKVFQPVWDFLVGFYNWVKDKLLGVIEKVINGINKVKDLGKNAGGAIKSVVSGVFGGRESGGYIPQTGLYNMHAGEYVVPNKSNASMGGTVININGNMYGVDAGDIASALDDKLRNLIRG